ncbi:MAG TPA: ABC transporter ATP-binding protein [Beutenbergiaceae bacterium]|nr:ABC transporter ATP-binding protein [Beutenbergiaceae bacterium]
MSALIHVDALRYTYPSGVAALTGVDLRAGAGESVAIIGQNGAGKTTLAKLLNGLLRPASGTVWVNGRATTDLTPARAARVVGYVFQNPDDQIFHSTVRAELRYGLRRLGLDAGQVQDRIAAAAELCDLQDVLEENPYDLPYSVRKFVTIALVLALRPQVLVLDEPTAGQDLAGLDRIARIISDATAAGQAVLTITHDMEFVAAHAQRVVVLAQGRIIADDTVQRVCTDAQVMHQARLDQPVLAQVAAALGAQDLPLSVPALARWVRGD